MRLNLADIEAYARWSRDHNPLHVDRAFASGTYFGSRIAHGMLSVSRALALAPIDLQAAAYDVEFRGAVYPDTGCVVTASADEDAQVISVASNGDMVLSVRATGRTSDAVHENLGQPAGWMKRLPVDAPRDRATDRSLEDLLGVRDVAGIYRTEGDPPAAFDAPNVVPLHAQVFALCSYLVGMEVPGLRSLFTRARVAFTDQHHAEAYLGYRLTIRRIDRHFRILDADVEVAGADGRLLATCELRSYVRFSPVVPDLDGIRQAVGDGVLAGQVALVCGASHGLGADLAAAMALAGARVFAVYRRDSSGAKALQDRLAQRGADLTLVQGDLANAAWCVSMVGDIVAAAGRLDLVVLNACTPPKPVGVEGQLVDALHEYLRINIPLTQGPLSAALGAVRTSSGALVYVSSSFVSQPPPRFGPYVALKQACEGLVATAASEGAVSALVLRPPPLQTSWNDTPTGALGTIASARVAVEAVRQLASRQPGTTVSTITEFPSLSDAAAHLSAPPAEDDDAPPLPLAVAASFTADPLARGVEFWGRELGVRAQLTFAPYNQILQSLLDPGSLLSTNAGGLNVVLLRPEDWLRELSAERRGDVGFVRTHVQTMVRDHEDAVRVHRRQARAATLLLLCPNRAASGDGPVAAILDEAAGALVTALHDLPGLHVRHAGAYHDPYGVDPRAIHDDLRNKLGHIPYTDGYFHVLATIVVRHGWRKLAAPRKVVVVDCDNTLWRGVVGEVGAEGIAFDEGHLALQETLVRLSASGVLVCLCSKNEEEDVWRVFDARPEMRLRREHVVAAMVNWRPKSENIRELAVRLNLGLDSFVFFDDNHVECAEVRASCPEVLTLEWPADAADAARLLAHTWELDETPGTAEDLQRTRMYREEFGRQALRDGARTFRDFLDSLDLVVDIDPPGDDQLARASQLTLRTNQFNFTTIRRDEAELRGLLDTGRHDVRTVRVRDRFGDYGLVGLLIAERTPTALVSDTFLMSCRVLGRGAEHRMAAELGRLAVQAGLQTVRLHCTPTKRNAPARTFLTLVAGEALETRADGSLHCVLPAADLATYRYEPGEAELDVEDATELATDASPGLSPTGDSGALVRRREAQVTRSVYALDSIAALLSEIDGRPAEQPAAGTADVADAVLTAFARSLSRPVDEIRRVDQLEALGCDSFRIVEITVGLTERFSWLPATLLFEHRSVSAIIGHIEQLVATQGRDRTVVTAVGAAPAAATAAAGDGIAVVGLDLRCAGAGSPDELWQLLSTGGVAVRPVPVRRRYFSGPLEDDRPHWAGLVDDVEQFDAGFFGISPREADLMDPQLRLFLHTAWGALEDANAVVDGVDPETGVFAGVMYGDYAHHANRLTRASPSPYKSWESFSLANRLSQVLSLRGPSLAVDTACSSSGTALHLACRALADGDCRMAIVGGVNLILDPDRLVQLGRLGILSATGRCLAFGKDADGTVLGEGVGVVVLRRLSDAIERGDRIYGVIKGTGLSTGSGTVGFTAPNPQAQAVAIRRALDVSGVDPMSVGYVETHGTGTLLGDPIEVRGLTLGYGVEDERTTDGGAPIRIGSIKPNIGHLEAGAAVLSLIKVVLQLHRRTFLPSVSSEEPNPQIPFGRIPFTVQRALEPWEAVGDTPRRASLSSFGVGGANVHVVLEEAPAVPGDAGSAAAPAPTPPATLSERRWHLVTLSARSEGALSRQARMLGEYLGRNPDVSLGDLAHTLNTTRRAFEHRAALVVDSLGLLRERSTALAAGERTAATARGTVATGAEAPRVAFLFTGQGAQFHGMGRALYETQPVFREALDACAAHLDPLLDVPLLTVLYEEEPEGDRDRLDRTGYTQPALFAIEYALARLWQSWGVHPAAVVGHSVGEFAAMCIAGGLTLEHATRLVAARGRLMQALPEGGAMVSVAADETRVRAALMDVEDRVAIAGLNSPEQTVISGERVALERVVAALEAEGIRTRSLPVSHAFHSPLMRPMVDAFADVVRQTPFTTPAVPVVSCVAGVMAGDTLCDPAYWIRQVLEPVRFTRAMDTLHEAGITAYLEIGPQPVLTGLGRRCLGTRGADVLWLAAIRRDADEWQTLLASAAHLHAAGQPLQWPAVAQPFTYRQVPAPSYAFDTRPHWVRAPADAAPAHEAPSMRAADVALYGVEWIPASRPGKVADAPAGTWVIVESADHTSSLVARALEHRGARCVRVPAGEAIRADDMRVLLEANAPVRGVVHTRGLDAPSGTAVSVSALDAWRTHALGSALAVVQGALRAGGVPVWIVTRCAVPTGEADDAGEAVLSLPQSTLWGFGRTVALEHPECWGGLVDLPAGDRDDDIVRLVDVLWQPSGSSSDRSVPAPDDQVAIRDGATLVPRLDRLASRRTRAFAAESDATYLVTGGLGALGLQVARWLVDRGARHLVLTGRHTRSDDSVEHLRRLGASIIVARANVADAVEVSALLAQVCGGAHPLRGIVHAAGVDRSVPLDAMTGGDIADVLAAKMAGAWLLHDRTRDLDLDFFVCFSSLASVLGAAGRAHYAAANAFLDALAAERQRQGLPGLAVNWGPWAGGGMGSVDGTARQFEAIGNHPIDPADALAALEAALGQERAQVVVADVEWPRFAPIYQARRPRPMIGPLLDGNAQRVDSVLEADTPRSADAVARQVREEVAHVLGFADPADVPLDRGFFEIGLDSLSSVELVARLRQRFGVDCQGFVFDTPTVAALSERLVRQVAVEANVPVAAGIGRGPKPRVPGSSAAPDTGIAVAEPSAASGTVLYDSSMDDQLFAFHAEAFGARRRADWVRPRWHWMFTASAERLDVGTRVWLYRDGDRVVGHNGAIPVMLKVGDHVVPSVWLVETNVLRDYQSRAIGPRLMAAAHEALPFALSLGQTETMRAIQMRMGWRTVAPLQTAQLMLRPERVLRGKLPAPAALGAGLGLRAWSSLRQLGQTERPVVLEGVHRYDARHDALWERMAPAVTCAVVRDASYLNWKYVDQPGQQFIGLDAYGGDALVATTVWMMREPNHSYQYRRAFLVDVVAPLSTSDDRARLQAVVREGCRRMAALGADAVLCLHIGASLTAVLTEAGFTLRRPGRFLLVYPGTLPAHDADHVLDGTRWFVTQGDSDIDRPW